MPEIRHTTQSLSASVPVSERSSAPLFAHVLACLSHSAGASEVLREAAEIAQATGAELTALRVVQSWRRGNGHPADPVEWELARREEEARLHQLVEDTAPQTELKTEVIDGSATDCICRKARETDVDLTVLGSGSKRHWAEHGLGSTVRRVAENLESSLLIVPETAVAGARPGPHPYRAQPVLVPLDSSTQGESVLPVAFLLAQSRDAELVLLHAVPDVSLTSNGPPESGDAALRDQLRHRNERAARAYLERVRARLPIDGVRTRIRILTGEEPRHALARAVAEEHAGLVVLSARGLGGHPDLPVGSTAEYLMSGATVPVLLLRPAGAAPHREHHAAPRRPSAAGMMS